MMNFFAVILWFIIGFFLGAYFFKNHLEKNLSGSILVDKDDVVVQLDHDLNKLKTFDYVVLKRLT